MLKVGKLDRIKKINQLGAGPQLWFFLDRKIQGKLEDYDKKSKSQSSAVLGLFANELISHKISDIFKNDLQTLIRSDRPQIRVLMGDNGTGKTTHLDYFKKILEDYYHAPNFFFEIDLRHIAEKTEEGLWLAIFNQIYESLIKRSDIITLLKNYDERSLRKIYKSSEIAKNVKTIGQDSSEEYFYGENFHTISNIQAFFNGIIDILMENKILTIIAIDEVQQIEHWGEPVFQAFLESFISSTYDRYMRSKRDARLFFILSFLLKSPATRNDKYKFLEEQSPGFVSRMKGREIIFCNFTEEEHNKALDLIAEITQLSSEEKSKFKAETKSKLTYWMTRNNPREFGKYIKKIYRKLQLLNLTTSEMREIYEKEAREYIKPILMRMGFTTVPDGVTKIVGYNFDVYGEVKHRTTVKKCAFGEIKTTQRKKLKSEVERFSGWLSEVQKTSKYGHDDNYYFFISPFKPTDSIIEINKQYKIEWIEFKPPELIFESEVDHLGYDKKSLNKEERKDLPAHITLKSIYKKVSGLGTARLNKLASEGIYTIEDLRDSNLVVLAENITGISKNMLLNWKIECERLINP